MSNTTPHTAPTASWYTDPQDPSRERYWDGAAWSAHVRPRQSASDPYAPATPYAQQPAAGVSNAFSIAGIVLGAIAFLFFPVLFGPIGLVLGAVAKSKGEPLANRALLVSGLGLVVGMLLGAMLATATF